MKANRRRFPSQIGLAGLGTMLLDTPWCIRRSINHYTGTDRRTLLSGNASSGYG